MRMSSVISLLAWSLAVIAQKPTVIVTDCGNWVDDQLAIIYLLASPSVEVKGIVASHYGAPGTAREAKAEVEKLVNALGSEVPVWLGADVALSEKPEQEMSEGARRIVELAKKGRIYVLCMSAATDVALALRETTVVPRLEVYWVGGGPLPKGGRGDFNLANDVRAAQKLFDSAVTLYWMPAVGVADQIRLTGEELRTRYGGFGKAGRYLSELASKMGRLPASMWDVALAGVFVRPGLGSSDMRTAPRVTEDYQLIARKEGKGVVTYTRVRTDSILQDVENALRTFARREGES